MKRIYQEDNWPALWKYSYHYDLEEIYGEYTYLGYAYHYENRRDYTVNILRNVLNSGSRILDIAAAQGNFSLLLAELGYEVTWNDLRADLVDYVRAKHESGNITFAPGNAFELEFPSRFDAVLIAEVIEHVAHPDEFLKNTTRLVKPGGYILMTTPNGKYFKNKLPKFSDCPDPSIFEDIQFQANSDGHIFLLHEDEVRSFADTTGLLVQEIILITNPLTNGHVKLGGLLKILPKKLVFKLEVLSQRLPNFLASKLLTQMVVLFRVPI